MTQTAMILAHLKTSPITPIEALQKYGCFRLAARVAEIRNQGFVIYTEMLKTKSGARVARYRLVGKES